MNSKEKYDFGFIYLGEIHHINHFITIAVALAQNHNVTILTYPDEHKYLRDALKRLNGNKVHIKELTTNPFRAFTDKIKKRALPRKGFWMKKNRHYLLNKFDALFFTDYIHHKLLKYRKAREYPKFIKIPHGLAGRAYSYKEDLKDFDLHIIFGKHYKKQLENQGLLGRETHLAGYLKLDAIVDKSMPQLFDDDKPIVLYNPHFDSDYSSWNTMGIQVLKFFKSQDKFNLIFSPHINLFNKVGIEADVSALAPFENYSNIFIDTGSTACVDMVYTQLADVYLGDVSSQSLEFIISPRPCIFLNTHKVRDYESNHNYHFWKNGQVIDNIDHLQQALNKTESTFKTYKIFQEESNAQNIHSDENTTATERAVSIVLNLLKK